MQFSDIFGSSSNIKSISNEEHTGTSRFVLSKSGDASVANCNFHDISSDSLGGAIGCSTSSESSTSVTRLFIEETTFTTCKTTNHFGGGIYFYNKNNGECAISRTCAFNCSSTVSDYSFGQYAYISTKNEVTCKNEANETTITESKEESIYPSDALFLENSNIICSSVNITNNECYSFPALFFYPTAEKSACTSCIIYTSIVNNSANDDSGCILLDNECSRQLISTSNIIINKQSTDDGTTIEASANLFINESCIIGNEGKRVFWECYDTCQITITNCTLDSDIMTSKRYYGSFTIVSSKESGFINALRHIVTGKCELSFDSYGTLTAVVKTQKNKNMDCSTIIPYCKYKKQQSICSLLR